MPQSPQMRDLLERLVELGESKRGPFNRVPRERVVSWRVQPQTRTFAQPVPHSPRRTLSYIGVLMVVVAVLGLLSSSGQVSANQFDLIHGILPTADHFPIESGSAGGSTLPDGLGSGTSKLTPARPGAQAAPAPSSVADQPPLAAHEVFGFAPYWTLAQSGGFDLKGLTTLAYFSLDVNSNGTIDESGDGWDGYTSQNLIDLIDQAHAAGDRVVLSVTDFDQSSLDQLTSDPTAPAQLSSSLLTLVQQKNMDGVNLDFEGAGSGDQAGLTSLVTAVSTTLHTANPHYQVTMDTYASSAGDPSGFYNIPALSPAVDGFFVMAYQLNLKATPNAGSPMTSTMFSNLTTAQQYASAIPARKVILGLPFFGYDWPTSDGTLTAQPTGAPSVVTYGQEMASGNPVYWDPDTDTAWTSYQVGQQWHEAFFENPQSLYMAAKLATSSGLGGVGIWALGMDGPNDTSMVSGLDGNAPAQKDTLAGPSATSASPAGSVAAANAGPLLPGSTLTALPPLTPIASVPSGSSGGGSTTTTTALPVYQGNWGSSPVVLTPGSARPGQQSLVGTLSDFQTNDSAMTCLSAEPSLQVYAYSGDQSDLYVIAQEPSDCANAVFVFSNPDPAPPPTTTTSTTVPDTTPPD